MNQNICLYCNDEILSKTTTCKICSVCYRIFHNYSYKYLESFRCHEILYQVCIYCNKIYYFDNELIIHHCNIPIKNKYININIL